MEAIRNGAAKAGKCACAVNEAVQTRINRLFFPFNDKEIPVKLRKQAWAFRFTYISWTIGQTIMVFYCPGTYLWNDDGVTLNPHSAWTLLLMLLISWFFYFQVQASNPGYITAEMLYRFNIKNDVFGVGDNGEGDSFSAAVFRKITNLGRRAVTSLQATSDDTTGAGDDGEAFAADSSSSGEEDDDSDDERGATKKTGHVATGRSADNDSVTIEMVETTPSVAVDAEAPNDEAKAASGVEGSAPAPSQSDVGEDGDFVASDEFMGTRPGYYFASGPQGTGYYRDAGEQKPAPPRKVSGKTKLSESMARAERFLAGQDRGKAARYRVPKHDLAKYEQSRFVTENGEIGLDEQDDGTFQTKMDFADIADDFPLRSRYCKQADRVVPKFDHYCTLLGTPIGERNHALFWMYLVAQSIIILWGISIVSSGFIGTILFPQRWAGNNALAITNMVILVYVAWLNVVLGFVWSLSFLWCISGAELKP